MRATKTHRTTRRWTGALLAALLLLATALPAAAAPAAESASDGPIASLWQQVMVRILDLVGSPAVDVAPPTDADPDLATRQASEGCGDAGECEGGVDIEPHG